jgi:hypothetical protein
MRFPLPIIVLSIAMAPVAPAQQAPLAQPGAAGQATTAPRSVDDTSSNENAVQPTDESAQPEGGAVPVPSQITGSYAPLTGENTEGGEVALHLGVKAFYDDNGYNSSPSLGSEWQYSIVPGVSVQRVDSRVTWNASYSGGVSMDHLLPSTPLLSQWVNSAATVDITPHVQLTARESYAVANNPFSQYGENPDYSASLPQPGGLNPYIVTVDARRTTLSLAGNLTWQLDPHSSLGFSGGRSMLQYDHVVGVANLGSSDETDARIYYMREVSQRQAMGLSVQWQDLTFKEFSSDTIGRAVQYLDVVTLSKAFSISFYGGPQQFRTHEVVAPEQTILAFTGGGAVMWSQSHLGLRLGFDDGAYQGGGVTTAVRTLSGTANLGADLSRWWHVGVEAAVGRSTAFGSGSLATNYRTAIEGFSVERQLRHNFLWRARYAHLAQNSNVIVTHNRVETGITYTFARPWGAQ